MSLLESQNPPKHRSRPPTMLILTYNMNGVNSPDSSNFSPSSEKVENVVKPPQNPVISMN